MTVFCIVPMFPVCLVGLLNHSETWIINMELYYIKIIAFEITHFSLQKVKGCTIILDDWMMLTTYNITDEIKVSESLIAQNSEMK